MQKILACFLHTSSTHKLLSNLLFNLGQHFAYCTSLSCMQVFYNQQFWQSEGKIILFQIKLLKIKPKFSQSQHPRLVVLGFLNFFSHPLDGLSTFPYRGFKSYSYFQKSVIYQQIFWKYIQELVLHSEAINRIKPLRTI